eukprot:gnl/TRDRNA2_/TRDRNA2_167729_c3_seq1.p1 gnl/TRDRNA2_/TRDRNA2_167729_c3~~gnl/TRDRNA2_/TRDRNA2_167729_c3_seq1.p1  ORF type:complete len:782 (-),score=109.05 gnl/TRDRNA2_/TRDRNA2_167729_c3_seq1:183-2528(-)
MQAGSRADPLYGAVVPLPEPGGGSTARSPARSKSQRRSHNHHEDASPRHRTPDAKRHPQPPQNGLETPRAPSKTLPRISPRGVEPSGSSQFREVHSLPSPRGKPKLSARVTRPAEKGDIVFPAVPLPDGPSPDVCIAAADGAEGSEHQLRPMLPCKQTRQPWWRKLQWWEGKSPDEPSMPEGGAAASPSQPPALYAPNPRRSATKGSGQRSSKRGSSGGLSASHTAGFYSPRAAAAAVGAQFHLPVVASPDASPARHNLHRAKTEASADVNADAEDLSMPRLDDGPSLSSASPTHFAMATRASSKGALRHFRHSAEGFSLSSKDRALQEAHDHWQAEHEAKKMQCDLAASLAEQYRKQLAELHASQAHHRQCLRKARTTASVHHPRGSGHEDLDVEHQSRDKASPLVTSAPNKATSSSASPATDAALRHDPDASTSPAVGGDCDVREVAHKEHERGASKSSRADSQRCRSKESVQSDRDADANMDNGIGARMVHVKGDPENMWSTWDDEQGDNSSNRRSQEKAKDGFSEESRRGLLAAPAQRTVRSSIKQENSPVAPDPGQELLGMFRGKFGLARAATGQQILTQTCFDQCVNLAKKHNLDVAEVKKKRQEFDQTDVSQTGELSQEEFRGIVRKYCGFQPDDPVPEHLLTRYWTSVDADRSGGIDFEEFLLWSVSMAYSEEILVPDAKERHLRSLARQHDLCLPDVERVKSVFDRFDNDKSGQIDEEEFRNVLLVLMHVKNPADVSDKKLKRYWREVDTDRSNEISFEEFLLWYFTNFDEM